MTTYGYDAARRLSQIVGPGASLVTFTYDGDGARTSKTANGVISAYINDTRTLTQVLQETKLGNTITYLPGLGQHDPTQLGNAQWSYFHQDAQNNRALSDNGASVTKRWDYEPFGSVRSQSGTGQSDFQYAGEQKDAETGLINLRARYYDPVLGRFVSRDVLEGKAGFPQTFNRYAYALNNPIRFIDPSGYCSEEDGWDACEEDEESAGEPTEESSAEGSSGEDCCPEEPQAESEDHPAEPAASSNPDQYSYKTADDNSAQDWSSEETSDEDDADCLDSGDDPLTCSMPDPVCPGGFCIAIAGILRDIVPWGDWDSISKAGRQSGRRVKIIVIGEDMTNRVRPAARQLKTDEWVVESGADVGTYRAWRTEDRQLSILRNRNWINKQMDEGAVVIDIGASEYRRERFGIESDNYKAEVDEVYKREYPNYYKWNFDNYGYGWD